MKQGLHAGLSSGHLFSSVTALTVLTKSWRALRLNIRGEKQSALEGGVSAQERCDIGDGCSAREGSNSFREVTPRGIEEEIK